MSQQRGSLLRVGVALLAAAASWSVALAGSSLAGAAGLQPGSAPAAGMSAGSGSEAVPAVAITVTPAAGLADNQSVEVVGTGFGAQDQVALGECEAGATTAADCAPAGALVVTTDSGGGFTTAFTVSRIILVGGTEVDCSTAGACVLAAGKLPGLTTFATAAISFAEAPPPTTTPAPSPSTRYYLALGDSLATGFGAPTGQGYVDDLAASLRTRTPGLESVDLGCPGETTVTFVRGGKCPYAAGSQLGAAEAFLSSHQGQVVFVTIDIGGDDVTGCAKTTPPFTISSNCVGRALGQIESNLAVIGAGLRAAAGASVSITGMTYFDPFVVEWLNGMAGEQAAKDSLGVLAQVNAALSTAYASFGAGVADVAGVFSSTDLTQMVASAFGTIPKAVAVACAWLFVACQAGDTAVSVHPNATGYAQIAAAFAAVLGAPAPTPQQPVPTQPAPALAFTGFDAAGTSIVGVGLVAIGAGLLLGVRRRRGARPHNRAGGSRRWARWVRARGFEPPSP